MRVPRCELRYVVFSVQVEVDMLLQEFVLSNDADEACR